MSSYPDLKNGTGIEKTDQGKLKQYAEQLKSVFATKVELQDKGLEWVMGNFLMLNIQNYYHWKLLMIMKNSISLMKLIKSSSI